MSGGSKVLKKALGLWLLATLSSGVRQDGMAYASGVHAGGVHAGGTLQDGGAYIGDGTYIGGEIP